MGRISVILLIIQFLFIPSYALDACVVNSYSIPPAQYIEKKFKEIWKKRGNHLDCNSYDVKVLIGTPAVVKSLKESGNYKRVYTFVLFPEVMHLDKKKNFYGVRIFPLPEKTYLRFLNKFHLKKSKVAVPLSKKLLNIGKIFLPKSDFIIITFNRSPVEIFSKLEKYKYIYIFPDPNLLKTFNLISLINFASQNNIKVFSGIFDLKKFNLTYVDDVDFDQLVNDLILLSEGKIHSRILPCPCKQ